MAKLIKDEQTVKAPSQFLKVKDGSEVVLQSNLIAIVTHFIRNKSMSVICAADNCYFCSKGMRFRNEYFYIGNVDKERGIIRLPASIFYSMNKDEKVLGKSKRMFEWIISKEGEGLKTKYSVTRGEDIKEDAKEVEKNNKELVEKISRYEEKMKGNYSDLLADSIFMNELENAEVKNGEVSEVEEPH